VRCLGPKAAGFCVARRQIARACAPDQAGDRASSESYDGLTKIFCLPQPQDPGPRDNRPWRTPPDWSLSALKSPLAS